MEIKGKKSEGMKLKRCTVIGQIRQRLGDAANCKHELDTITRKTELEAKWKREGVKVRKVK